MKIKNWLLAGCILIHLMLVIGCITRLTHSGLSITQWSLFGSLPPVNESDWNRLFSLYQASPEYLKVNRTMDISEFKSIYFWEYLHRLTGRIIGLVFIGGLAYFIIKKNLLQKHYLRFGILFGLGLLQGLIGWWMVKSGLADKPAVSHYRLAIHLLSAFILFGFTFWFYLEEIHSGSSPIIPASSGNLFRIKFILVLTFVIFILQLVFGAFTAGFVEGNQAKIRPGNILNTWPKMGEEWFPEDLILRYDSLLKNFTENPAGIQFVHRWLAFLLLTNILLLTWFTRKFDKRNKIYQWVTYMLYAIIVQILLGIYTLIDNVPIYMGVLHQSGALLFFLTLVGTAFHLFKKKNSVSYERHAIHSKAL